MPNEQKTPIARTLPLVAQRAALMEIERRGHSLPCHVTAVTGAIVTVAFDVASPNAPLPVCQMPLIGAEYIRYPIQTGCKGVCRPSSVDIGIVTGLGPAGALPSLDVVPANMSMLVFEPVGNASWTASPNANALVLYGAGGGVIAQDIAGSSPNSSLAVTASTIAADTPEVDASENLSVGNGASGTFTTGTGQTVDVIDGIIVNIY